MTQYAGYGIVNGVHTDRDIAQDLLKQEMTRLMRQGWIPQGGVCHVVIPIEYDMISHVYTQAIVKPVEAP